LEVAPEVDSLFHGVAFDREKSHLAEKVRESFVPLLAGKGTF
jgi:hypothetical protein